MIPFDLLDGVRDKLLPKDAHPASRHQLYFM